MQSDIKGMTVFNTEEVDTKTDFDEPAHPIGWKDEIEEKKTAITELLDDIFATEEEHCDSCAI